VTAREVRAQSVSASRAPVEDCRGPRVCCSIGGGGGGGARGRIENAG